MIDCLILHNFPIWLLIPKLLIVKRIISELYQYKNEKSPLTLQIWREFYLV